MGERKCSYDSLQEHLLKHSLRRALRKRDWKYVAWVSIGWAANYLMFAIMLIIFFIYGCRFQAIYAEGVPGEGNSTEGGSGEAGSGGNSTDDGVDPDAALFVSWAWSVGQRFLVNEPFIILFGALLPLLFASAFCSNLCTESCNNTLTVAVTIVVTCLKSLRRVGG